jgi:CheY-like chemotaxis protein
MKILAADDQPLILRSIGNALKTSGYEIIYAQNGEVAIEMYNKHAPDLVIVDLNMPIFSGFDVIEHIRKIKLDQVPIIVMTANDEEKTVLDAFYLGVDDYIEKPVGVKEVLVRVNRLLKQPLVKSESEQESSIKQILSNKCVGVVIPCYNEEKRLSGKEFTDFVEQNHGYHFCFVNDGSKDKTLNLLESMKIGREDTISVFNCVVNGGKAEAVRQGVLSLASDVQFDYIGYLDADLSTNFDDFADLMKTLDSSKFKIVSGSRISRMGANITKASARQIISQAINLIIRMILGMSFQDTQCGAKIMTREIATNMFNEKFVTRWIFDVEIFLRMKKYYGKENVQKYICEQPLKRWVHADGSKLSMKDSIKIIGQLGKIFLHYR